MKDEYMIRANNITKKYNCVTVLDNIGITIEPGKITTLIGPSGGGKTTLLRAMSLIDVPDSGSISIDETRYIFPVGESYTLPWPKLSVVFQQLFLWPHLTLRQNILLPFGEKTDMVYLEELIGLFGMENFVDHYPNQSSLGQKQRAALVRALILKPDYLFLDEITSALDIEQVAVVLSHLQTLRNRGVGIFMATHLIKFAERASDHIIFLDKGRILESGDRRFLKAPKDERVQQFLSIIKSAS